ncbi:PREDICTED: uncharacterized protein LOC109241432 [Nicotiana attenuata]|uniref:uncharacterized protein LOC109241432 n=1 Tax=Nicotiana attenuata TaxID=49451 RepID=UPI000904AEA2|nr:PREDICTED: uncharacterized protein LOC109241432 [Nicotiana attenuata]
MARETMEFQQRKKNDEGKQGLHLEKHFEKVKINGSNATVACSEEKKKQKEIEVDFSETPLNASPSELRSPELGEGSSKTSPNSQGTGAGSGKLSWADEAEIMEIAQEANSGGTIWDNFDITKVTNAGFKLEFVEPIVHDETPVCEIETEDIKTEIEYWKNVVVCYVLGAHPPFTVINAYVRRIWEKHGINKVSMLKNGIVIVRFNTSIGKNEVLQGDMEFTNEELYAVPICIKLPGLDFKYWSPKGLCKIGSLVGRPLMVDSNTEKKIGLSFARLLVEVQMDTKLPDKVVFKNERGLLMEQKVQYDWKPTLCKVCRKYGHDEQVCKNKKHAVEPKPTDEQQVVGEAGLTGKQDKSSNSKEGGRNKQSPRQYNRGRGEKNSREPGYYWLDNTK